MTTVYATTVLHYYGFTVKTIFNAIAKFNVNDCLIVIIFIHIIIVPKKFFSVKNTPLSRVIIFIVTKECNARLVNTYF